MNIRKPADYTALHAALDALMGAELTQMELCCEIGRLVNARPEKGAAVAAAEYLHAVYPDVPGFSPRNLRRMRDFYRAYEDTSEVRAEAMAIGWTQNTIILEAELTVQEKLWYIRAVRQFGWSKLDLIKQIAGSAHLEMTLDVTAEVCYTEENGVEEHTNDGGHSFCREDQQHDPSPRTARNGEALNPWETEFCAMGTPIPMGMIPAPTLAGGTRKTSDGQPFFDHRAMRCLMRDKMAAQSLEAMGKPSCLFKCSADTNRTSLRSCWELTICSKLPVFLPRIARIGWNSS